MPIAVQHTPVSGVAELGRMTGIQQQAVREQLYGEHRAAEERGFTREQILRGEAFTREQALRERGYTEAQAAQERAFGQELDMFQQRSQFDDYMLGRQTDLNSWLNQQRFTHELNLDTRRAQFQEYMAGRNAELQAWLRERGFAHDKEMQEAQFGQQAEMQDKQFQFQDYMANRNLDLQLYNMWQGQEHDYYMTQLNSDLALAQRQWELEFGYQKQQILEQQNFAQNVYRDQLRYQSLAQMELQTDLRDWQEYQARRKTVLENDTLNDQERAMALSKLDADVTLRAREENPFQAEFNRWPPYIQSLYSQGRYVEWQDSMENWLRTGAAKPATQPTQQQTLNYYQDRGVPTQYAWDANMAEEFLRRFPGGEPSHLATLRKLQEQQQIQLYHIQAAAAAGKSGDTELEDYHLRQAYKRPYREEGTGFRVNTGDIRGMMQGQSAQGAGQATQQILTGTNPETGERIISYDGGKTWQPMK